VDLTVGAMSVVAAQIARIGSSLIKVSLLGLGLAFEFKDNYSTVHEEDDVRPARFQREFVLQNGSVSVREFIGLDNLAGLDLDLGDGIVPGANLRVAGVRKEFLERYAHDARLGVREGGEVTLPAISGTS
jgi:hypothetical protein